MLGNKAKRVLKDKIMNCLLPSSELNWKKVGKITRPFRYDLNEIPYNSTVEVTNRFKGLDMIDRVAWRTMDGGFVTLYMRQWSRPSPRKRNARRQNGCLRRPYKIAMKRREVKGKGEKEIYIHLNVEFQRKTEIRKPSSVISAKK